ncbi:hypothetical protein FRC08_018758 [Ceratobasidium sp. 394]|nr:hypothetical protein FRC08_018758 [Ceratobasidium sp. 394]
MASKIDNIYKSIVNDARVRAAVDKITRHFPKAPFTAIVIGTGSASEHATFVLIPLLNLVPGAAAAGSLVSLVKSAVSGKPVPPGSIFTLLQALIATGLGVPPLVVGTMVDGTVRIVKELQGDPGAEKGVGEQKVVEGEAGSAGDGAETDDGESGELIAERADTAIGDKLDKANDTPQEHAPSVVGSLVSGVSEGVAKTVPPKRTAYAYTLHTCGANAVIPPATLPNNTNRETRSPKWLLRILLSAKNHFARYAIEFIRADVPRGNPTLLSASGCVP